MFADVDVISNGDLHAVIDDTLAYLREVGEITGDMRVAGDQIAAAIQSRWTVFSEHSEGGPSCC